MSTPPAGRRSNLAIPIAIVVGLVLAAAVLGLLLRSGDDGSDQAAAPTATPAPSATATAGGGKREPNAMTIQQARNLPLGSTRNGVYSRFGPPKPPDPELPTVVKNVGRCVYYNFAGTPEGDIRLCFRDGRLAAVTTVYP